MALELVVFVLAWSVCRRRLNPQILAKSQILMEDSGTAGVIYVAVRRMHYGAMSGESSTDDGE